MALYLSSNGLIDTTVQKAFMREISGCTDHNLVLQELLAYAKKEKKTLHCMFFDLAEVVVGWSPCQKKNVGAPHRWRWVGKGQWAMAEFYMAENHMAEHYVAEHYMGDQGAESGVGCRYKCRCR
jgi:hypothetical protein